MNRCPVGERHRTARQGPAGVLALRMLGLNSMLHPLEAGLVEKSADLDSSWKRLEGARIAEAEVLRCCDRLHR